MNNKGKITVFISLLMSGLVLLGLTAVNVIDIYMAKEKVSISAKTAVSNIKANYNSYIFEHYHILLFDKNCGGSGEAMLEEMMMENMQDNLGENYEIESVAISDINLLIEDECAALKQQINDYMAYEVVEYGVDKILEETGGKDGQLPENIDEQMDSDRDTADEKNDDEAGDEESGENGSDNPDGHKTSDPRKVTKKAKKKGLLSIVMPKDMKLSDTVIDLSRMPSVKYIGLSGFLYDINADFDDYDNLKSDIHSHEKWADKLVAAGTGTAYARHVYNCATDNSVNETAKLNCEVEYLICGKKCDYDNLEGVVGKITAIRLPVNYVYLLTDVEKMSKVKAIAWPLSFITLIPEPILKYLIAGCWAYGEAIMEVRSLLRGDRLEFVKSPSNWITDIDNLETTMSSDAKSSKKGLCYEDYLMILMALDMKDVYYRMLDVMQVNVNCYDESFCMENATVNVAFDIKALYDGRKIAIKCSGGY